MLQTIITESLVILEIKKKITSETPLCAERMLTIKFYFLIEKQSV